MTYDPEIYKMNYGYVNAYVYLKIRSLRIVCTTCKWKKGNKFSNKDCFYVLNCHKKYRIPNFTKLHSKIRRQIKQRFIKERN